MKNVLDDCKRLPLLTREAAFQIIEIDEQIEWLMFQHDSEFNKEIEELKKQKILIYEDSCDRF